MVKCPVCGAWVRGGMGHDQFLRCPICRARLRVTKSNSSVRLLVFAFFLALVLLETTNLVWFFFWPLFPLVFAIRSRLAAAVAVPEWASSTPQPQAGSEPTRSAAPSRQGTIPTSHATPARGIPVQRYCIYCGAVVNESDWRFCANCGASLMGPDRISRLDNDDLAHDEDPRTSCMVCGLAIQDSDQVVYCIHCGNVAHRLHLLEWIHVKGRCPICDRRLNEGDIR
jgi:uncharacterized paraquat-inducible protein A